MSVQGPGPVDQRDQFKLLAFHLQSHQIALGGLNLVSITDSIPQFRDYLALLQQISTATNARILNKQIFKIFELI